MPVKKTATAFIRELKHLATRNITLNPPNQPYEGTHHQPYEGTHHQHMWRCTIHDRTWKAPYVRVSSGGKRKHRWNYRKDISKNTLPNYDPTLTEYQNMQNHGFWRVWD